MTGDQARQHTAGSRERLRTALTKRADTLEEMARINIENGLFAQTDDIEKLIDALSEARSRIAKGDMEGAASSLTRGEHLLHCVLYKTRSFLWRFVHLHQVPLFAYYLVVFFCALNIGSGYWTFVADEIWSLPVAALGLGAMGAVLRGLWWLYQHVARRTFRMSFLVAHLAAPWIGALFGLFTYLLLLAGVVSLEGATEPGLNNGALPMALAFLAGYSWEWVLDRVDRLRGKESNKERKTSSESEGNQDQAPEDTRNGKGGKKKQRTGKE